MIVDCFTDWPIVVNLGNGATSGDLMPATQELFSQTAVSNVFWSDGGLSSPPNSFRNLTINIRNLTINVGLMARNYPLITHKVM